MKILTLAETRIEAAKIISARNGKTGATAMPLFTEAKKQAALMRKHQKQRTQEDFAKQVVDIVCNKAGSIVI